jgi:hypothetical protein
MLPQKEDEGGVDASPDNKIGSAHCLLPVEFL